MARRGMLRFAFRPKRIDCMRRQSQVAQCDIAPETSGLLLRRTWVESPRFWPEVCFAHVTRHVLVSEVFGACSQPCESANDFAGPQRYATIQLQWQFGISFRLSARRGREPCFYHDLRSA